MNPQRTNSRIADISRIGQPIYPTHNDKNYGVRPRFNLYKRLGFPRPNINRPANARSYFSINKNNNNRNQNFSDEYNWNYVNTYNYNKTNKNNKNNKNNKTNKVNNSKKNNIPTYNLTSNNYYDSNENRFNLHEINAYRKLKSGTKKNSGTRRISKNNKA
jgi:hypothetical protein